MARPPKNQPGPSAVERMEDAFWYMLDEKPFPKITVSDIVKLAHVNRNAFYYHYDGINDLADKSVQALLVDEGSHMLAEIIETNGAYLAKVIDNPERGELLKRVRLIAGSHSSPELTDMLKQAMINMWLTSFQVDEDKLDPAAHIVITFAVGGFLEVLGKWKIGEKGITPQTFVQSGMATTAAELVARVLAPVAEDKSELENLLQLSHTNQQEQAQTAE